MKETHNLTKNRTQNNPINRWIKAFHYAFLKVDI